ncbi:MAG: DUF3465 domain-containing protein [Planctomycetes bacterium]|nr:DUF3465 domain-containing protein [Planctomycetota bacterium]
MNAPTASKHPSTSRGLVGLVLALLGGLGYLGRDLVLPSDTRSSGASVEDRPSRTTRADEGERAILDAFAAKRSNLLVEVRGRVKRKLADDTEGSPHQKWILTLAGGHTVLVAHNLDLAPRVPLEAGDELLVRGEYEYSREGGVLHWTHDDPARKHPGGWVELRGQRYE